MRLGKGVLVMDDPSIKVIQKRVKVTTLKNLEAVKKARIRSAAGRSEQRK